MAISLSIKKNTANAKNNAKGIINTPPLTNNENRDSFPAVEVPRARLSTCNKILNMDAGFNGWQLPLDNYAKTFYFCNETKQNYNSCTTKC
jgi:hypothetical protein